MRKKRKKETKPRRVSPSVMFVRAAVLEARLAGRSNAQIVEDLRAACPNINIDRVNAAVRFLVKEGKILLRRKGTKCGPRERTVARHRRILEARVAGVSLADIAAIEGMSVLSVRQTVYLNGVRPGRPDTIPKEIKWSTPHVHTRDRVPSPVVGIFVSGGVVQRAVSSRPDVEVVLIDEDDAFGEGTDALSALREYVTSRCRFELPIK
jgi:hypothetical protein